MDYNKIRKNCRIFRIAVGLGLIVTGYVSGNAWFYLGGLPLVAGLVDFCPICLFTKKCDTK